MKTIRVELIGREEIDLSAVVVIEVADDITEKELQGNRDLLETLVEKHDAWSHDCSTGIYANRIWVVENGVADEPPIAKVVRGSDGLLEIIEEEVHSEQ